MAENSHAVSRRRFLGGAAGIAGVSLLGAPLFAACSDDSLSDTWFEPRVRSSSNGTLSTRLQVADTDVSLGGSRVKTVTYEGTYPGPTLEIRPGDTLNVDFQNRIDEPTNLHTHGLHVSPKAPGDDVLMAVEPGQRFGYHYRLGEDHPGGTYWYHAHQHTLSDTQVFAGLFGALIVRGALDELPGVAGRPERMAIISQTQLVDGKMVPGDASSNSLQVTLVNGVYQPSTTIAPGEIQRWRFLNASSLFLRLQFDGHPMHVIAIDGDPLTATDVRDVVEIVPGARADVLIEGATHGTYQLRSLSWAEYGPYYSSMIPEPQPLLSLTSTGRAQTSTPMPTTLLPLDDLRTATIARRRRFVFEEIEPRGTSDLHMFNYYINGKQFDHNVVNETMYLGDTEEWYFVNKTYEPHPIHIHVNDFLVVAINDQPVNEHHYRDTAMLPPFGTLTIRTRFADFTGKFVMHCHILFHEDHGMMQLLEVVDRPAST